MFDSLRRKSNWSRKSALHSEGLIKYLLYNDAPCDFTLFAFSKKDWAIKSGSVARSEIEEGEPFYGEAADHFHLVVGTAVGWAYTIKSLLRLKPRNPFRDSKKVKND